MADLYIQTLKLILAVFLAVTTHSICVNYDIDMMRPFRYNEHHATNVCGNQKNWLMYSK